MNVKSLNRFAVITGLLGIMTLAIGVPVTGQAGRPGAPTNLRILTGNPTPPPPPPPYNPGENLTKPPYDWVGIIGSGQSLSVGATSAAVSLTQPFKNLTLLDSGPSPRYPMDGRTTAVWSVVPLVEPHRTNTLIRTPDNNWYPENIMSSGPNGERGETPHSGMGNSISAAWARRGRTGDYITAHSAVGAGGLCLEYLEKGSHAYLAGLSEARVYKQLAGAAGKFYGAGGVIFTHGECDTDRRTQDYGTRIWKLYQDYNTDLRGITGQANDIVFIASQQSSITGGGWNSPAVQLWRQGRDHPGKVVVSGPKYAYGPYGLHMLGPSYQRIGEKYGEVFDLIVNQGVAWRPLGPNRVTRSGTVITIDFDVPNPPLVWDANLPVPHQSQHRAWSKGKGFEVIDAAGNELEIASAEIVGNSVRLTMAQTPPALGVRVGYALTADAQGFYGGTAAGLMGLLRDSDPFEGAGAENIQVQATQGSNTFSVASSAIARRAPMDIVSATGLAVGTVVTQIGTNAITLSSPWTGASGTTTLRFQHNHYNYAVHFAMDVP
jgi:hypothetical protein